MQRIIARIPTSEDIEPHKAKLAGLGSGVFGALMLLALAQVLYTGRGLGEDPPPAPMVYPNL